MCVPGVIQEEEVTVIRGVQAEQQLLEALLAKLEVDFLALSTEEADFLDAILTLADVRQGNMI